MRYLIVLSALALALAAAGPAAAGGWATVGFAPLPDGTEPGGPWNPEITILQHGRTPLDGLSPTVTISEDGGTVQEFAATATGESGVYEADVVFPTAGSWNIVIDSGFGESRVTYGPVTIEDGSPVAVGRGRSFPTSALAAVGGAIALLAAGVLGIRRLRRLTPASR
jgi:hypothetical protein